MSIARPLVGRLQGALGRERRRYGADSPRWRERCRRGSIARLHRAPRHASISASVDAPADERSAGVRWHRPAFRPPRKSQPRARCISPSSPSVHHAATPTMAKSPRRRAISMKHEPVRGLAAGNSTSTSISSGWRSVVSAPTKKSDASIHRSPAVPTERASRAASASAMAGSSEAGSACERFPPMVPRLRICGCAICGSASAISGKACAIAASRCSAR